MLKLPFVKLAFGETFTFKGETFRKVASTFAAPPHHHQLPTDPNERFIFQANEVVTPTHQPSGAY